MRRVPSLHVLASHRSTKTARIPENEAMIRKKKLSGKLSMRQNSKTFKVVRDSVTSIISGTSSPGSRASSITSKASIHTTISSLYEDVFTKDEGELIDSIETFARDLDLGNVFRDDWELFRNLVCAMRHKYNNNPFHNFKHGFSVSNMAALFLQNVHELQEHLDDESALAFFVAALGHDVDHPGNDNSYEVNSHSQLAEIYSQQSVLENHHITTLLKLLEDENTNVFQFLNESKQKELTEFMRQVVIGTDMAYHKTHLKTLKGIKNLTHALKNPQRKTAVMRAILHACDLSGQVLSVRLAAEWEERIVKEMKNQADKSISRGVELPSIIQKLVDGDWDFKTRAEVQLGFVDHVLIPLWKEVGRVFPTMKAFHEHLNIIVRQYYVIVRDQGIEEGNKYFKHVADLSPFDVQSVI